MYAVNSDWRTVMLDSAKERRLLEQTCAICGHVVDYDTGPCATLNVTWHQSGPSLSEWYRVHEECLRPLLSSSTPFDSMELRPAGATSAN
jgi:hypothetical protein